MEDWLDDCDTITDYASAYSEPGYTLPEGKMVIFGSWWGQSLSRKEDPTYVKANDPVLRLATVLERSGHVLEWHDEWWTCGECGNAIRTTADSYSWTPSYVLLHECEVVCVECIAADPEEYVQHLLNNDSTADTFGTDLEALGFVQIPEDTFYESGWHPGQTDDPAEIGPRMTPEGHDRVWQINGVGQFDIRFTMWTRPDDYES